MDMASVNELLEKLRNDDETVAYSPVPDATSGEPSYSLESPVHSSFENETDMKWTRDDVLQQEVDLLQRKLESVQKDVLMLLRITKASNHCVRDMAALIKKKNMHQ